MLGLGLGLGLEPTGLRLETNVLGLGPGLSGLAYITEINTNHPNAANDMHSSNNNHFLCNYYYW